LSVRSAAPEDATVEHVLGELVVTAPGGPPADGATAA
jgi:hypothetical protein